MKTAKYQKRCLFQIEGIVAENKALTTEVDHLRAEAEEKAAEKAAQEERLLDLNQRLADKDREKKGKSCVPSSCSFTARLVLLTSDYFCRSGGGDFAPPRRKGATRPGAYRRTGGRAPRWRGAEEQELRIGW